MVDKIRKVSYLFSRLKGNAVAVIHKLLSLRASPHQIAVGFAIGVFVGIFPTFGFGALLILALASVWKFNFTAALIGTVIGNPLLAPLWITLTCLVTGISPGEINLNHDTFHQIFAHFSQIGLRYLIGNFSISIFFAIISYFSILHAVRLFTKQNSGKDTYK